MSARFLQTLRFAPCVLAGLLISSSLRAQPADELVITPQAGKGGTSAAARPKGNAATSPLRGPKLVLVLVADQFRADTLTRYRGMLGPSGLLRLARGATAVGHHGQQNTYTGPGHALIATGAHGYLNGITQNKWFWKGSQKHQQFRDFPMEMER